MVKPVLTNSAAGFAHPGDPNLNITAVAVLSSDGIPTSGGSHTYGYNASGQMITDTWTHPDGVFIKTYTYTNGVLTGESDWVKQ